MMAGKTECFARKYYYFDPQAKDKSICYLPLAKSAGGPIQEPDSVSWLRARFLRGTVQPPILLNTVEKPKQIAAPERDDIARIPKCNRQKSYFEKQITINNC